MLTSLFGFFVNRDCVETRRCNLYVNNGGDMVCDTNVFSSDYMRKRKVLSAVKWMDAEVVLKSKAQFRTD